MCLVATVLDSVALHFTFTMNDVTIHLVDQTTTLAIAPQFLIWGISILIYWLYTFFFIVYLELAYWRPKYIIKKPSGSWLPRIQIPRLKMTQTLSHSSLLAYVPICRTYSVLPLQCWFLRIPQNHSRAKSNTIFRYLLFSSQFLLFYSLAPIVHTLNTTFISLFCIYISLLLALSSSRAKSPVLSFQLLPA